MYRKFVYSTVIAAMLKMGITVHWYDDSKTIMIYKFVTPWTVEDVYHSFTLAGTMAAGTPMNSIIFDVTEGHSIPPDLLSAVGYLRGAAADNIEIRVFVGEQKYPRKFLKIIRYFVPQVRQNVYFVDTIPEAVRIIQQRDSD